LFTEQEVKITRNARQQVEWIARGDYLIGIGHRNSIYMDFVNQGLPLSQFTAADLSEGSYLSAASASIGLVSRAPHPNAAKVYINWLLSKETQLKYSQETGYWSRRVDVSQDHLDPAVIPKSGNSYMMNYKEVWIRKRKEVLDFLKTVIKK